MAAEEASMEEAGLIAEVGWKIAAQWNDGTWRKFCNLRHGVSSAVFEFFGPKHFIFRMHMRACQPAIQVPRRS